MTLLISDGQTPEKGRLASERKKGELEIQKLKSLGASRVRKIDVEELRRSAEAAGKVLSFWEQDDPF